jgi:predicted RNA-binding protein with PUA-like domain
MRGSPHRREPLVDEAGAVGYPVAMAHWLLKSEPEEWSWDQQVAEGRDGAEWTGIRNFSARNNLRAMKKGEQAFFYHTAHPDSTDSAWQAVNVAAVKKLPKPVTLEQIKADKRLKSMTLVRISRLSVQPVSDEEWKIISRLGGLD